MSAANERGNEFTETIGCSQSVGPNDTEKNLARSQSAELARLESAKLHAPTLTHYWYWCEKIRELKAAMEGTGEAHDERTPPAD